MELGTFFSKGFLSIGPVKTLRVKVATSKVVGEDDDGGYK